jgi:hypothetical protein
MGVRPQKYGKSASIYPATFDWVNRLFQKPLISLAPAQYLYPYLNKYKKIKPTTQQI